MKKVTRNCTVHKEGRRKYIKLVLQNPQILHLWAGTRQRSNNWNRRMCLKKILQWLPYYQNCWLMLLLVFTSNMMTHVFLLCDIRLILTIKNSNILKLFLNDSHMMIKQTEAHVRQTVLLGVTKSHSRTKCSSMMEKPVGKMWPRVVSQHHKTIIPDYIIT